jgi:hypothetical protein
MAAKYATYASRARTPLETLRVTTAIRRSYRLGRLGHRPG